MRTLQNIKTIAHVLVERGTSQPDGIAFKFCEDPRAANEELRYGQLLAEAGALAREWPQARGERVLLVLRSNRHFVVAFFACLLAGAVPVPTAVPRRENLRARLLALIADARPVWGVTDLDDVLQQGLGLEGARVPWINLAGFRALAPSAAPDFQIDHRVTRDSLAFLQYTSGSTGDPKGVMVTHDNIMHNSAAIARAFRHDEHCAGLVALPLFHDMGLIGGVLQPLYAGFPVEILNPALAVQKPAEWLRRIAAGHITTSGGPNFLFDWACKMVSDEDLAALDLSAWKVAFCGAEPVRRGTVEAFVKRFAAAGFRREAFFPCYGLAEATLYVAGAALAAPTELAMAELGAPVPCGVPGLDTQVCVVDAQTACEVEEGAEGELWVQGPGVAQGYWQRPDLSASVFGAELANRAGGRFLRTGDIGYRSGGLLYVTGRLKDLIIVRGRNFAPDDLEFEIEQSHPQLLRSGSAAFAVAQRNHDALVVVAEVSRQALRRPADWPVIEAGIRTAITLAFQLRIDEVVLLRPGSLPRTSSGKVRRSQCRADYLAQTLTRVASEAAVETS